MSVTGGRRSSDRAAIDARMAALPPAYDELLAAAAAVAEPLTTHALAHALGSPDARRRIAVGALERALEKIVNYLIEIADRGLREARRVGHPAGATRGRSLDRLHEAGVVRPGERRALLRLVGVRNLVQHDYLQLEPAELVAAVELLQTSLHDVVHALDAFLGELDALTRGRG